MRKAASGDRLAHLLFSGLKCPSPLTDPPTYLRRFAEVRRNRTGLKLAIVGSGPLLALAGVFEAAMRPALRRGLLRLIENPTVRKDSRAAAA
jgi:uncharacterized membrane protein SpoIIM required for sporulation